MAPFLRETYDMPACRIALRSSVLILAAGLAFLAAVRCSGRKPEAVAPDTFVESLRGLLLSTELRSGLTPLFYKRRDFRPVWLEADGPRPEARSLLGALAEAEAEGLDPCEYGLDRAEALVFQAGRAAAGFAALPSGFKAELDAALTDSFFLYASHLASGKANPSSGLSGRGWPPEDVGLTTVLEQALDSGEILSALLNLAPRHVYYLGLRRALAELRCERNSIEATLGEVPPAISGSGSDSRTRQRDLVDRRIETLRLNLERWRWLPRFLGRRFILVDSAGFRLLVGDRGRIPLSMKTVVGSLAWQTPVLRAEVTGFIINPHWDCPPTIFYKETINSIRADKNYLPSNKMVILEGWGSTAREVDPALLDWTEVSRATHPTLRLRQLPGPLNILGRLKFIMPNPEDIYLHDTPYQDDFKQKERIFSHGCIRAEQPFDLAAFLAGSSRWTADSIRAAVDRLDEQEVRFREPVPIYVNYVTAWPGPAGRVEFRRDVYGRDARLAAALGARTN